MATLGPYTLTGTTLFEGNGCEILEATLPDNPHILWAIKIKDDNHYDVRYLEKLKGVRNCVEVPADAAAFTGSLPDGRTWYAMRKYDDTVDNRKAFSRDRWRQIARDVLQFLQDAHSRRLAHLDIKTFNILYDAAGDCFRVCDFEHMTEAEDFDDDRLCTYDAEHAWYYAMLGGDLNHPYESYRMDLEALGFVLSMLTWPAHRPIRFLREYERRMREELAILTVEETVEMRKREIAATAPPALAAYYAAIQDVAWTTEEPPSPEFYDRLKTLFADAVPSC